MVRRVWRFLLPANHRISGLICPCLVAWSPWFIFLLYTVVSHIYAYERAKTLSFILLIQRKSTEFENESNV